MFGHKKNPSFDFLDLDFPFLVFSCFLTISSSYQQCFPIEMTQSLRDAYSYNDHEVNCPASGASTPWQEGEVVV